MRTAAIIGVMVAILVLADELRKVNIWLERIAFYIEHPQPQR